MLQLCCCFCGIGADAVALMLLAGNSLLHTAVKVSLRRSCCWALFGPSPQLLPVCKTGPSCTLAVEAFNRKIVDLLRRFLSCSGRPQRSVFHTRMQTAVHGAPRGPPQACGPPGAHKPTESVFSISCPYSSLYVFHCCFTWIIVIFFKLFFSRLC